MPVVGPEIPRGTIVIENGRITAVHDLLKGAPSLPFDAVEVELNGKVILPGFFHPDSADGLDVANENLPVTPYLDVFDAIDPSELFFEESLRNGVTSIHCIPANNCVIGGVSRLLHPIGRTPDEMTQRIGIALKLATSPRQGYDRMLQLATLRGAFRDLDEYLERLAERRYEEDLKEKGEEIEVGPAEARKRGKALIRDEDLDDAHANLVKLRDGRLDAWIYCGAAMDVGPALAVARDQGFIDRTVLVLGAGAHLAIGELKNAGRPVVLAPELMHRTRDPVTGKLSETFVPRVIHDAALDFALQPHGDGSLPERYLNYQAARCVREGIPRQKSIEAITIAPARMLRVDKDLGSIEPGKLANLAVYSGDPLDFNSVVEKVYIHGVLAYERERDPRLKTLTGEKQKEEPKPEEKSAPEKPAGEKPEAPPEKSDAAKKDETTKDESKKDESKKDEKKKSEDNGAGERDADDREPGAADSSGGRT